MASKTTRVLGVRMPNAEVDGVILTARTMGILPSDLCREAFRVYLTPEMAQLSLEAKKRGVPLVDLSRRAMWQYVSHELNRSHKAKESKK